MDAMSGNESDQPPLVEEQMDDSVHDLEYDPACDAQSNAMDATNIGNKEKMNPNQREIFDYKNVHHERHGY